MLPGTRKRRSAGSHLHGRVVVDFLPLHNQTVKLSYKCIFFHGYGHVSTWFGMDILSSIAPSLYVSFCWLEPPFSDLICPDPGVPRPPPFPSFAPQFWSSIFRYFPSLGKPSSSNTLVGAFWSGCCRLMAMMYRHYRIDSSLWFVSFVCSGTLYDPCGACSTPCVYPYYCRRPVVKALIYDPHVL